MLEDETDVDCHLADVYIFNIKVTQAASFPKRPRCEIDDEKTPKVNSFTESALTSPPWTGMAMKDEFLGSIGRKYVFRDRSLACATGYLIRQYELGAVGTARYVAVCLTVPVAVAAATPKS